MKPIVSVCAALVALALPGSASALSLAPALNLQPDRSCGWVLQVSADQANILFPDAAATYWVARVPLPEGARIEIKGRFPYARYTSLTSYTSQYQAIDGLHDARIEPDAGSQNPFRPGADRTASNRSYTVSMIRGRVPAGTRTPNTLYSESTDGAKTTLAVAGIVLRIYEGDKGRGIRGGVALPSLTLVLPTGLRVPYPECPSTNLPDLGIAPTVAAAGSGSSIPGELGLLATDPPSFRKFTNLGTSVVGIATQNEVTGTTVYPAATAVTDSALPSGGFAENPDNKYVSALFSSEFGAVLELRGKAPTFAATRNGEPLMATGQVRYWSLCSNAHTTAYYGCMQDDQVPLDADGNYRFVVSTAAARPANATEACGVAWLPAGPLPQSILILRNMLPDATFAEAIQRTTRGNEEATMGAYYPRGKYYGTTADYEALGC